MARLWNFSIILALYIKQNTVGKLHCQKQHLPKEYAVIAASYKDHVNQLQTNYESALLSVYGKQPPDGVLLYSGSEQCYTLMTAASPFKPTGTSCIGLT